MLERFKLRRTTRVVDVPVAPRPAPAALAPLRRIAARPMLDNMAKMVMAIKAKMECGADVCQ